MKKSILLVFILPLISCGIKKELKAVKTQNTELIKKKEELTLKNKKLEIEKKELYKQNQECRRKVRSLLDQNRQRNNDFVVPIDIAPEIPVPEEIFTVVETMPEFPGGKEKLLQFLVNNIKYPNSAKLNGVKGKVYIQFVVNENGEITNPRVIRGIGSGCDEEALRVIKKMPKWTPGKQRGKALRVRYVLPVNFKLR